MVRLFLLCSGQLYVFTYNAEDNCHLNGIEQIAGYSVHSEQQYIVRWFGHFCQFARLVAIASHRLTSVERRCSDIEMSFRVFGD